MALAPVLGRLYLLQLIELALRYQTVDNELPSTWCVWINFALPSGGSSAGTILKTLGTPYDRADCGGGSQLAVAALGTELDETAGLVFLPDEHTVERWIDCLPRIQPHGLYPVSARHDKNGLSGIYLACFFFHGIFGKTIAGRRYDHPASDLLANLLKLAFHIDDFLFATGMKHGRASSTSDYVNLLVRGEELGDLLERLLFRHGYHIAIQPCQQISIEAPPASFASQTHP